MNERIRQLARQSGATDENGSRATTVYCFTDQELKGFAELIVKECAEVAANVVAEHEGVDFGLVEKCYEHFGVDA